jgi:hypothetical protein
MDSQHLNALSVQSLYYIADTKMHEIDLECLSTLPQTLRALQAQLTSMGGAAPQAPQASRARDAEAESDGAESPTAVEAQASQPTFSRRAVRPAPAPLSAA